MRLVGVAVLVVFEGLVGGVNTYTDVEADDESVDIQTESGTRSEGYLACPVGVVEDTVMEVVGELHSGFVIFQSRRREQVRGGGPVPYVSCIDKRGSVEFPYDWETEFEVRLQFDVAGMEEGLVVFGGVEVSRSVGGGRGSPEAVRSAGIESFGQGCCGRVAERYVRPCEEACSDADLLGEVELIPEFSREFDEAVESDATQFLGVVPFLPEETVEGVNEVAGLLDAEVKHGVHRPFGTVVVIDEVISDGGHKLVSGEDLDQLGVLFGLVQQVLRFGFDEHDGERERRESMGDEGVAGGANEIGEGA